MKATIKITDTQTGTVISNVSYGEELDAQYAFEDSTEEWSNYEKRYKTDLIAHHPRSGDLIRRTMYSSLLIP